MPELPEVEHVRKSLSKWIGGAKIIACHVHDARIVRPDSAKGVARSLEGKTVKAVDRRGKWLRIAIAGGPLVFSHLGMTGWFVMAKDDAPVRFERIRLTVKRGSKTLHVVYTDTRRWGRFFTSERDVSGWTSLGQDPLHDDVDLEVVHARLQKWKKRSIKDSLMDQRLLAGVGNIHATEALWKAAVDPRSRASAIGMKELAAIMKGIHWTFERTLADFAKGDRGSDDPFVIYGHAKQPCPRCKKILVKAELAGRTTTWCPGCQKRLR